MSASLGMLRRWRARPQGPGADGPGDAGRRKCRMPAAPAKAGTFAQSARNKGTECEDYAHTVVKALVRKRKGIHRHARQDAIPCLISGCHAQRRRSSHGCTAGAGQDPGCSCAGRPHDRPGAARRHVQGSQRIHRDSPKDAGCRHFRLAPAACVGSPRPGRTPQPEIWRACRRARRGQASHRHAGHTRPAVVEGSAQGQTEGCKKGGQDGEGQDLGHAPPVDGAARHPGGIRHVPLAVQHEDRRFGLALGTVLERYPARCAGRRVLGGPGKARQGRLAETPSDRPENAAPCPRHSAKRPLPFAP